jgi:hypothetical protein
MLTSKDQKINVSERHARALDVLGEEFNLDDQALDGNAETLGMAGGILKRRWSELGQIEAPASGGTLRKRGNRTVWR